MDCKLSYNSTMGYDHHRIKMNCQDSLFAVDDQSFLVGFVVDGVGDEITSPFSEVGSRIIVKLATQYVEERLRRTLSFRRKKLVLNPQFWLDVQNYLLDRIEKIAVLMGGNYKSNILRYFIHTLTGFVVVSDVLVFVGIGDGFAVVNDIAYQLTKPTIGNMPASLSYNLVESTLRQMSPEEITLSVKYVFNTADIVTFAVATDGLRTLVDRVLGEDYFLVKPEYCFWEVDEYFENPEAFGIKLRDLATQKRTIDWSIQEVNIVNPVIKDDLAIVMGRKK